MNTGKKVLVVEDYDDSREFMKFLLEEFGFEVVEATNGCEAVEMVLAQLPDLILMDISMPVMDGLTATRQIRANHLFDNTPIIAITALGESHYKRIIEAGCDDLLNKPLDIDALQPVLNEYLSH
jgi:CheY-like chemotaxis protein